MLTTNLLLIEVGGVSSERKIVVQSFIHSGRNRISWMRVLIRSASLADGKNTHELHELFVCFESLLNFQRTTHREHTAAALLLRDATFVTSPCIIYEELQTLVCATLCFVDNLWEKVPRNQPRISMIL